MLYAYAPLVLIVLGGVLMAAAMRRGPETNDVVMAGSNQLAEVRI